MNRWKAYGSVSNLVKQFEAVKTEDKIDLKKSQSLEEIRKSHDFKTIYSRFENRDNDIVRSNLIKYESTNHLECLQLQEINQARKKLYEITGKLGRNPSEAATSYREHLRDVSQLILSVANVSDYGHAAIKSEKAQLLPLMHRCYLHIRDKLVRENLDFHEDELVKMIVGENCEGGRYKNVNIIKGDDTNVVQRKYEKNPSSQYGTNSHQDPPKKTGIISRRISKLQATSGQNQTPKIYDHNGIRRGNQPHRSSSFHSARDHNSFDVKTRWDTSQSAQRNSWYSSRSLNEIQDSESDSASIVSGHDMFEQKYSGIADRINKVLKKRISMLEEDGLLN